MTQAAKDVHDAIAPKSKKAAVIARKAVNTAMNHGEEIVDALVGEPEPEPQGGAMTQAGKDVHDAIAPKSKKAAVIARKAMNTAVNHGEDIVDALVGEPQGGSLSMQDHHDMSKFIHRSYHNYHHLHHHVGNMSPYMHRGWRAVANILAGGEEDPMFPHIKPHHFSDYKYSDHARAPKGAYKDIARSDRYSLMDALEDEYHDFKAGKSSPGLWHACNSVAKAAAHWGSK